jgi:dTDP-glucose pyrophosphorylase
MELMDRNAAGIALVVDDDGCLIDTVTDGDVRRALLAHTDIEQPVSALLDHKRSSPDHHPPITAPEGTLAADLITTMNAAVIRQVPLVDDDGRVTGLALLSDLVREYEQPLTAVVMAGGFGRRLMPLTESTPKPMLPVGGRPVLEHILDGLRSSGIKHVNLTTHFKGELIHGHFGDGADFGLDISYVNEDQPLGTAGALALLEQSDGPLLVMNGDVLTRVDFAQMHAFHAEHEAAMTVAVKAHEVEVPYGVIETDGSFVREINEKPRIRHFINAGIYILDPQVRGHIEPGEPLDMPQLVQRLVAAGLRVASFPVHEYWIDIGHYESLEQAERDLDAGKMST